MGVSAVYKRLYDLEVFTLDDVARLVSRREVAKVYVERMVKRGEAIRIKRGLYSIVPLEFMGKEFVVDRFLVGSRIADDAVISYHSALELHGAAYSSFNTLYACTSTPIRSFEFQEITYRTLFAKYTFGVMTTVRGKSRIRMTDRERTFLDCLARLDLVGGFEEFLKSVSAFPYLNIERLYNYLSAMDRKSLFHKVGYVLQQMQKQWSVEPSFLKELQKHLSNHPFALGDKGGKKKYVAEWHLLIPEGIELVEQFV